MDSVLLVIITALLGGIAYFIKGIFDKTKSLEENFKPITPALVEIQSKFKDAGHNLLFPLTVTPGSPLKLTDYGRKLIKESGFDTLLETCRNDLVQKVKDKKPTTNYDIQEDSISVIRDLIESDDVMLKPLKEYAFNNGISADILTPPAGIVLRDEVMKELKF